jgi:hypothetical protein
VIAALYIDPRGPYPRMEGVDCWDAARDARFYAGPHPVVAHPPCAPWSSLKHMRRPDDGRVATDAECGPRAVEQVRRWGGVLEQPARSKLWDVCSLPTPVMPNPPGGTVTALGGGDPGFTICVEQVAWGHVARKPTWLYCVGIGRPDRLFREHSETDYYHLFLSNAEVAWRREHAHRVWQAMQAVVAVMAIVDLSDSIFSEYWDEAARIGLYLDSNATGGGEG